MKIVSMNRFLVAAFIFLAIRTLVLREYRCLIDLLKQLNISQNKIGFVKVALQLMDI